MNNMYDISSTKEIDLFTALLGGSIPVNTLAGTKNVKIHERCQPNTILRIRQAGMKTKHKTGDHLLNIKINLPKLTEEQKELLQKLKEQMEENNG